MPQIDLDSYCSRIGYQGPRTPTLETLRTLHELHPAAIVFEAIDVLLNRGVDLSPAAVDAKLIVSARGGYCYEHNSLFKRVLTALGFEVEGLVARVRWMAPPEAPPRPRTHMALRVTLDGVSWLGDVGFGNLVLTAPLRLECTAPQPTRHETFRLVPLDKGWLLQARLDGEWRSVYELSREAQLDVDYELANWFTATHPSSPFRRNLMVARTTPQARYTLLHNRLTVRSPNGGMERRALNADALEHVLAETFGLPVEPGWRPLIERAVTAGQSDS
ncbi:arylamine N-acetyltransferase family protein [Nitrococcus mobilis]|uniref:N-hydroxyarylamine O-acetyltransferase n=1 Tax=Nitrococcus mobilis Nb-231 TaxID=314278 RepID=A4BRN2_9GAMM|nr:arylamine N-acetyltransferase [Nitrococcus mobilis]EAR21603.1 N-hydroxyarylamine O-acetyltransferase [Nitrococcus mobilis Nb-231]